MTRPRVYVSDPERQRKYRKRKAIRMKRYDFALKLLSKAQETCVSQEVNPGLAAEIEKFLKAEP